MKYSLYILIFFALGLVISAYDWLPNSITELDISTYTLWALLFFVGFFLGSDKESSQILKHFNLRTLLVPCCVIVGSYLGSVISSFWFEDLATHEALAVGFGFAYYSLSSIMISELHSAELGAIALLANIIRELFTIVACPLLVLAFGKLAPIVAGGATTMDTSLPVIVKYSGKAYVVVALFSGILLTILVPILVGLVI